MNLRRLFKSYKNDRERDVAEMLAHSLHISFKNLDLYITALRHKSAARNIYNKPEISNERLEFLGDAILDAAVADYLYKKYPDEEEGELTKIKSRIVSRNTLNRVAIQMGIDQLIETDLQATHSRASIAGNALEAIFGAMYLDLGYVKTYRYILGIMGRFANLEEVEFNESDFKSRLYEEAHKIKSNLRFNTRSVDEKDGKRIFKSDAFLDAQLIGKGIGTSKKKAEQKAAKEGLQKLNLKNE
ncbi:MAG: ribonuclease III [Cryomorphaceae bacterium]